MLEQLDVASKDIKDTEVLKRNYFASQNVYEKANDQKKEQPPGCQATSDGSTTGGATYSQPSRPAPKSAANGHEAQSMRQSTDLTHTNRDSRPNGAEASTRDQASNELTSHTPPFDVIATFAYTSEEQDELGFEVNDRITVLPWEDSEDELMTNSGLVSTLVWACIANIDAAAPPRIRSKKISSNAECRTDVDYTRIRDVVSRVVEEQKVPLPGGNSQGFCIAHISSHNNLAAA
ncbi:unnamed protein product [Taenia asiatica]|uniref:SH3 domain-containing protein n=1 Tax=Taenia asiatica TaxID=60517 RepID=A0A158R9T0_TAEAS|nr:unnamed protein product [Taenia asiatica]